MRTRPGPAIFGEGGCSAEMASGGGARSRSVRSATVELPPISGGSSRLPGHRSPQVLFRSFSGASVNVPDGAPGGDDAAGSKAARRERSEGLSVVFDLRGTGNGNPAKAGEGAGAMRTHAATTANGALSVRLSRFMPRGWDRRIQTYRCRLRMSGILLHNPHFICRCLLSGEPTLAGKVPGEGRVGEIESSRTVAPMPHGRMLRAGLSSDLATAPRSIDGLGPLQHGFRSENDLAVRRASGAGCSLEALSAAHCSSRTRWLGQIRKCRPWRSLA
jgi:hypothetical protein